MKKFLTLFSFFCAFNGFFGVANADVTIPMITLLSGDRHSITIKEETPYDDLVNFAKENFKAIIGTGKVDYFVWSGQNIPKAKKVDKENWDTGDNIRGQLLKEKSSHDNLLTIILEDKSATRQN